MEVGSIWGHGSYVAPDWTADWLHREATFVLDDWAAAGSRQALRATRTEEQARLRGRLEEMYRRNTYDAGHEHDSRSSRSAPAPSKPA